MELIVAIVLLVVFALLAARFGYDSRDGFQTKDRELARYGVSWVDAPADSASRRADHCDPRKRDGARIRGAEADRNS